MIAQNPHRFERRYVVTLIKNFYCVTLWVTSCVLFNCQCSICKFVLQTKPFSRY
nr:MAG TPA_asm: hypothetical protein [Caudoviricetes sp.]